MVFCFLKYVEQQAKGKLARTVRVALQRNWLLKGKMLWHSQSRLKLRLVEM